jgi:dihydrodipicolinate synthase/N-acetylneuraminate lyase
MRTDWKGVFPAAVTHFRDDFTLDLPATLRHLLHRWFTPLLHLDTHVKLVQYIKLAVKECGLGSEAVRPARLPPAGMERERVLGVIRRGIAGRPSALRG